MEKISIVKLLDQIRSASFWRRYWSLLTALVLPVLVFVFWDFQNTRMLVSIISAALLGHAWRKQVRGSQSIWPSLLWTSALLLPMLGAIWLGINVIRFSTYEYAADYHRHLGDFRQNLYWYAVETQDWIMRIEQVDVIICLLLAVTNFFERTKTKTAHARHEPQ